MTLIEFHNVSKQYRRHFWTPSLAVVSDLSFSVKEGTVVGFIGPNGAGKTTSLKMLMGLVRPTKGRLVLNGRDAGQPQSRKGIAFLSEQPYFYDHLTVLESITFAYQLCGLPPAGAQSEIARALETVKLTDVNARKVKELSKGMQQRLNMACALLGNPFLYILDEPMSGLDPLGRTLFRTIFRDLAQQGKTIFFSTHILDDIELLCDSIVVLAKGKLTYDGPITPLLDQGFLGTDITVHTLREEDRRSLAGMGYAVSEPFPGISRIFVPKDRMPREVQQWLFEHGIFCESIERRNESLETLLYGDGEGKH
jgi:ABC-2 type transport system ATP-binding protein